MKFINYLSLYQHNTTSRLVKNPCERVFLDVDSGYKDGAYI